MKILVTGPESAGKTTIANSIANRYSVGLVKEVSREFLIDKPGYVEEDVHTMALLQRFEEIHISSRFHHFVCDTDLLTFMIWSDEKYGGFPDQWRDWWLNSNPIVIFLCKPDIPWECDPLRENPHDRERLFEKHVQFIDANHLKYDVLQGNMAERMNSIEHLLDGILT